MRAVQLAAGAATVGAAAVVATTAGVVRTTAGLVATAAALGTEVDETTEGVSDDSEVMLADADADGDFCVEVPWC